MKGKEIKAWMDESQRLTRNLAEALAAYQKFHSEPNNLFDRKPEPRSKHSNGFGPVTYTNIKPEPFEPDEK